MTKRREPIVTVTTAEVEELGAQWLREAIAGHVDEKGVRRAFFAWPALEGIAGRYAALVSPWFPFESTTLLRVCLDDIAREFETLLADPEIDPAGDFRAFARLIAAVFKRSETIMSCRVVTDGKTLSAWEPGAETLAEFWRRNGQADLKFLAEGYDYELSAVQLVDCLASRLLRFNEVECLHRGRVLVQAANGTDVGEAMGAAV